MIGLGRRSGPRGISANKSQKINEKSKFPRNKIQKQIKSSLEMRIKPRCSSKMAILTLLMLLKPIKTDVKSIVDAGGLIPRPDPV